LQGIAGSKAGANRYKQKRKSSRKSFSRPQDDMILMIENEENSYFLQLFSSQKM
jgi:hypothetical protein